MIISRVPFRISFVGGGTDLKAFYEHEYGVVLSTTINKYIYITVKKQSKLMPNKFRISYFQTENVDQIDDIQHPIVRETLKYLELDDPLEITVFADIPAKTGLGSSSSFTVGLLHALHTVKGEAVSPDQLAEEAAHIEIDVLQRPIGKQDHYAPAFGGINEIKFMPNDSVIVNPVICSPQMRRYFFDHLMVFYTYQTRDSHSILAEQKQNTIYKLGTLRAMKNMVAEFKTILEQGQKIERLGELLDEAWEKKKTLQGSISNGPIDILYDNAKRAGATGGKLLGAGGGGFLLFWVPPDRREAVEKTMPGTMKLRFDYEPQGSTIVYFKIDDE